MPDRDGHQSRSAPETSRGGGRQRARYERWVRDHADGLYRLAYRLCGDAAVAEELVQETFYEAWKGMRRLRDPQRARNWLMRILRRRHARWRRELARWPGSDASPDSSETPQPGPVRLVSEAESLQAALDQLPDRYKVPLLLVFLEDLSCREVASQLDLPVGTVLSRLHRGRQRLRDALNNERPPDTQSDSDGNNPPLRLGGGP